MAIRNEFEISNGQDWTSLENEAVFLNTISTETDYPIDIIGTSFKGKEICRLKIGTGNRSILITGGVHGDEPAGRESVLRKLRDVAYNESGEYTQYLSKYTIHFVPTVNPDGRELGRRHNGQNIDINRDTILLATPEGNMLISLMNDIKPDIHVDFHERSGVIPNDLENIEFIRTMFFDPNADTVIKNLSNDMVTYMIDELSNNGFTNGKYYPPSIIGPGMMTGASGILGAVEMVPETYYRNEDKNFRVDALSQVFEQILDWHLLNEGRIIQAKDSFMNRMIKPGEVFVLLNGDSTYYLSATEVPIIIPEGYILENRTEFEKYINVYNIEVDEDNFVSINQPSGRLLPRLLDPSSDVAVTSATRVEPKKPDKRTDGRYTKVLYDEWREIFIKNYF